MKPNISASFIAWPRFTFVARIENGTGERETGSFDFMESIPWANVT